MGMKFEVDEIRRGMIIEMTASTPVRLEMTRVHSRPLYLKVESEISDSN